MSIGIGLNGIKTMRPAYIRDTVIYGVTDRIPNIKFKNNMKKVYVLVRDCMTRGEQTTDLKTFSSKEKARKVMNEQYQAELSDWKSWCEENFIETEETENSKSIWETGEYHENHTEWTIYEQEVL